MTINAELRWQLQIHRNVLERTAELLLDMLTGEPLPEQLRVRLWRELLEVQDCLDFFEDNRTGSIGLAA